jgi:hypothetical protein
MPLGDLPIPDASPSPAVERLKPSFLSRALGEHAGLKAAGIVGGLALAGYAAYEMTRRKEGEGKPKELGA